MRKNKNNNSVYITEAPYDRKSITILEQIFGNNCITEKNETLNKSIILKNALKGASKSGQGYGIPDSVIYLDNEYKNPFVFVEVKSPNQMDLALNDLLHYHKKVYESSIYIPFALAISGEKVQLKKFNIQTNTLDDVFLLDSESNIKSHLIINNIEHFGDYKEVIKSMYLSNKNTYDVNIPGFTQDEIISFCVEVNHQLHAIGIKEDARATILTYFLVCCLNSAFIAKLDNHSMDDIYTLSKDVFKKIVSKKKFTLNKNTFSALTIDVDAEGLSQSDRQSYYKYVDGFSKIFEVIDNKIASDFKGRNINRSSFVNKLIQSGNLLGDAYEVFQTYASGNDMGQYFTPRHAVDLMITLIEKIRGDVININDIIYDPACGVGGFLCLALKHATTGKTDHDAEAIREKLGGQIYGSEYEPAIADMARVNMLLRGDGKSGIVTGSSLDKDIKNPNQQTAIKELFEKRKVKPTLILMNPPFPSDKSNFESYEFIEHAIEVADDNAYIGAIIPVSVINGKKHFKKFRKNTLKIAELKAVITLPIDLFEPKASVDTAIIILKKTKSGHQNSNVYFASCNSDGLLMHKGKKQRISDYNTINDFSLLRNFWMEDVYNEVYEKFKFCNPSSINNLYFIEGGEWSPYQWLSDNPISIDDLEIIRLAKYINTEYQNGEKIKNLGGRW
jgi:type I restriction-modification system DNA methylase subunit